MSQAQLIDMAKQDAHGRAGTRARQTISFIPAISYRRVIQRLEMDRIFKRVPLMAATTTKLRDAGSIKPWIPPVSRS